jgi:isoleucyl-tRNA synthetase
MISELTPDASFTRIEEDVRRFWRRHAVPDVARDARGDSPSFVVCQQPLEVATQTWNDQVRLLTVADLYARYRAMQGFVARCHTGWSCHGVAVERLVEEWARSATADPGEFVSACWAMALEEMTQIEGQFERLGMWFASPPAFVSLTPEATGAVWSALRQLWDAGRLRREQRVVSVCPSCATPLSTVEAARHPLEVEVPSLWVRLPWDGEPGTDFLVWTAYPWMLVGMVALAVHPEASYVLVELQGQEGRPPTRLLLAEVALGRTLSGDYQPVRRMAGKALRDACYHPPFTFLPAGKGMNCVIVDESVPLEQGTGVLPVTPAFDALSLALADAHDLPIPELLDDWGGLDRKVTPWRGLSPLDTEPLIVENLRERGLVERERQEVRPGARCPYCETRLLSQARHVWQIDTASGAWVVGRDRLWGAPLPVWTCQDCGQELCVAGLDDLAHRTGLDAKQIDPHRPMVDHLTFPCDACSGTMRRVAAVVDTAFEVAVLPWATAPQPGPGDPSPGRTRQCLAVGLGDKDLGWLSDFTEVVALLRGELAWAQAVAMAQGDTESLWELKPSQASDALRWAACAGTSPEEAEQAFMRPLWRLVIPALRLGASSEHVPPARGLSREKPYDQLLHRWLQARLHRAIDSVTDALDGCTPHLAAGELGVLVDELSVWQSLLGSGSSLFGAGQARDEALDVLARLTAPFTPHLAEAIHRLARGREAQSVHLAAWPLPDPGWENPVLLARLAKVRACAALTGVARERAGVQPDRILPQAQIVLLSGSQEAATELVSLRELLAEALGVFEVQVRPDVAVQVEWHLALNPTRAAQREVSPAAIEYALASLSAEAAATLASQLREGLSIRLEVEGRSITLLPDEVDFAVQAEPGWIGVADRDYLVLLAVG